MRAINRYVNHRHSENDGCKRQQMYCQKSDILVRVQRRSYKTAVTAGQTIRRCSDATRRQLAEPSCPVEHDSQLQTAHMQLLYLHPSSDYQPSTQHQSPPCTTVHDGVNPRSRNTCTHAYNQFNSHFLFCLVSVW